MAVEARLERTRQAFDALAPNYDTSEESNELLLRLRHQVWEVFTELFPPGARLLDLGCGTGIDAAFLAREGYRVVATDISPRMVECTQRLADAVGVRDAVEARVLAIEEIQALDDECFDGIYCNRGPLNCAGDLRHVAGDCARLLKPGGLLVATVIGRICPWEMLYFAAHGEWRRAGVRLRRGFVSVPLQGQEIPTRYLTPPELYASFVPHFELVQYRSLCLFLPPTYLAPLTRRYPRLNAVAAQLDDALGTLPGLRNAGDMFLIVLRRNGRAADQTNGLRGPR